MNLMKEQHRPKSRTHTCTRTMQQKTLSCCSAATAASTSFPVSFLVLFMFMMMTVMPIAAASAAKFSSGAALKVTVVDALGTYAVNQSHPSAATAASNGNGPPLVISQRNAHLQFLINVTAATKASCESENDALVVNVSGVTFNGAQSILAVKVESSQQQETSSGSGSGSGDVCAPPTVHITLKDILFASNGVIVFAGDVSPKTVIEMVNVTMSVNGNSNEMVRSVLPDFRGVFTGWSANDGVAEETTAAVVVGGGTFAGSLRISDSNLAVTTGNAKSVAAVAVLVTEIANGELRCDGPGTGIRISSSLLTVNARGTGEGSSTAIGFGLAVQTAAAVNLRNGAFIGISDQTTIAVTAEHKSFAASSASGSVALSSAFHIGGGITAWQSCATDTSCPMTISLSNNAEIAQKHSTIDSSCSIPHAGVAGGHTKGCASAGMSIASVAINQIAAVIVSLSMDNASYIGQSHCNVTSTSRAATMDNSYVFSTAVGLVLGSVSCTRQLGNVDMSATIAGGSSIGQFESNYVLASTATAPGVSFNTYSTTAALMVAAVSSIHSAGTVKTAIILLGPGRSSIDQRLCNITAIGDSSSDQIAHSTAALLILGAVCSCFTRGTVDMYTAIAGSGSSIGQSSCTSTISSSVSAPNQFISSTSAALIMGAVCSSNMGGSVSMDTTIPGSGSTIGQSSCTSTLSSSAITRHPPGSSFYAHSTAAPFIIGALCSSYMGGTVGMNTIIAGNDSTIGQSSCTFTISSKATTRKHAYSTAASFIMGSLCSSFGGGTVGIDTTIAGSGSTIGQSSCTFTISSGAIANAGSYPVSTSAAMMIGAAVSFYAASTVNVMMLGNSRNSSSSGLGIGAVWQYLCDITLNSSATSAGTSSGHAYSTAAATMLGVVSSSEYGGRVTAEMTRADVVQYQCSITVISNAAADIQWCFTSAAMVIGAVVSSHRVSTVNVVLVGDSRYSNSSSTGSGVSGIGQYLCDIALDSTAGSGGSHAYSTAAATMLGVVSSGYSGGGVTIEIALAEIVQYQCSITVLNAVADAHSYRFSTSAGMLVGAVTSFYLTSNVDMIVNNTGASTGPGGSGGGIVQYNCSIHLTSRASGTSHPFSTAAAMVIGAAVSFSAVSTVNAMMIEDSISSNSSLGVVGQYLCDIALNSSAGSGKSHAYSTAAAAMLGVVSSAYGGGRVTAEMTRADVVQYQCSITVFSSAAADTSYDVFSTSAAMLVGAVSTFYTSSSLDMSATIAAAVAHPGGIAQFKCIIALTSRASSEKNNFVYSTAAAMMIGSLASYHRSSTLKVNVTVGSSAHQTAGAGGILQTECDITSESSTTSAGSATVSTAAALLLGTASSAYYGASTFVVSIAVLGGADSSSSSSGASLAQRRCTFNISSLTSAAVTHYSTAVVMLVGAEGSFVSSTHKMTLTGLFANYATLACADSVVTLLSLAGTDPAARGVIALGGAGFTQSKALGVVKLTLRAMSLFLLRNVTVSASKSPPGVALSDAVVRVSSPNGEVVVSSSAVVFDGVVSNNHRRVLAVNTPIKVVTADNGDDGSSNSSSVALVVQHSQANSSIVVDGRPWLVVNDTAVLLHCNTDGASGGSPIEDVSAAIPPQWQQEGVRIIPCANDNVCHRDLSCFGPGTSSVAALSTSGSTTNNGGSRSSCGCNCHNLSAANSSLLPFWLPCGPSTAPAPRNYNGGRADFFVLPWDNHGDDGVVEKATPTRSPGASATPTSPLVQAVNTATATRSISFSHSVTVPPTVVDSTQTNQVADRTSTITISPQEKVRNATSTGDTKPARTRSVTALIEGLFNGDEAAAGGVVGTGATSAAVAGVTSPGALSQMGKVNGVISVATCAFDEDDARPPYLEVPLQMQIGSSPMRWFTGSTLLTSAVLICFPTLLHVSLYKLTSIRFHRKSKDAARVARELKYLRNAGRLFVVCVAFSVAGVVQSSVTAITFGNSTDQFVCVVAGLVPSMIAVAWLVFWTYKGTRSVESYRHKNGISAASCRWYNSTDDIAYDIGTIKRRGDGNAAVSGEYVLCVATMEATVDSLRSVDYLVVSLATPFDVVVSFVVAIVSGMRPSEESSCQRFSAFLVFVGIVNLSYHVAVRPFRAHVDTVFAVLHAILLFSLAVAAAVALSSSSNSASGLRAFSWIALGQMVAMPCQALFTTIMHVLAEHRRKAKRQQATTSTPASAVLAVPLVAVSPMGPAAKQPRRMPL